MMKRKNSYTDQPTIFELIIVEELLKKSNLTMKKLTKQLKNHVNSSKLTRILAYLEHSGKILINNSDIAWNPNQDGTQHTHAYRLIVE